MSESSNLALPLLQPSQAQKHVTVNEALVRLDGLTHLTLISLSQTTPPALPAEGATYGVPSGAVNAWAGQAGLVAIFANGGWVFVTPQPGWRGWVGDLSAPVVFDGATWVPGALGISPNGSASRVEVAEFDHVLSAGATSLTTEQIPQYAMVLAVTGRITQAITGTLTSWQLGVAGSPDRYGNGLGLDAGSWVIGMSGAPVTYYAQTPVQFTATGGDFAGGTVRLAVHYYIPTVPGM
ncbi:MAG: DUF2793 domain-containing protein [Rhodobacteraceae bacterium]|nr:DUF2793 domain-containing protein [Paracoccaceae bacterium]